MTTINSEPSRVAAVSLKAVNLPPPQRKNLPRGGQKEPPPARAGEGSAKSTKHTAREKQLKDVVRRLNDFVKEHDRTLHFSVDHSLQRTIVRVIDSETGETIRQIPSEEMLKMAHRMESEMSALIDVLA